jgi:hypothetical protein
LCQVQDEGHAHGARLLVVVDQEVAADVQFAVVFLVEAGGLLDVLVHRVFGDGQAVVLFDPALFFQRGVFQIHPDGLELGQLLQRLDLFLEQPAIGKREDVEHGLTPLLCGVAMGMGCFQPPAGRELKATNSGRFPRR